MEALIQALPQALFLLFCTLSVIFAFGVVVLKNAVSCAFSLVMVLLNVAGIFAMQEAYFISAVQVLVYAGAIMVLFVFVIMLLSLDEMEVDESLRKFWPVPVALGAAFFVLMSFVFVKGSPAEKKGPWTLEAVAQSGGNVRVISETMFSDYVLPFLVMGMLLSICIVGAVVLAKRRVD